MTDTEKETLTTDDLIKGYWDNVKQVHVRGLWERVTSIERLLKLLPHALILIVGLEIALLAKNASLSTISQVISWFIPKG